MDSEVIDYVFQLDASPTDYLDNDWILILGISVSTADCSGDPPAVVIEASGDDQLARALVIACISRLPGGSSFLSAEEHRVDPCRLREIFREVSLAAIWRAIEALTKWR
jgi:hypothetical protein